MIINLFHLANVSGIHNKICHFIFVKVKVFPLTRSFAININVELVSLSLK